MYFFSAPKFIVELYSIDNECCLYELKKVKKIRTKEKAKNFLKRTSKGKKYDKVVVKDIESNDVIFAWSRFF